MALILWPMLYIGSLWHEHCDPFVTIIATSQEDCKTMLDGQADDAFNKLCDDDAAGQHSFECSGEIDREGMCNKCNHQVEDTVRTGGVFEEKTSSVELSQEQIADLETDGVTFGGV